LLLVPSQYSSARWVDFGVWFGGNDLCANGYTADTCGLSGNSLPPANLRHSSWQCNYYFNSKACCCQGLVWAPDAPKNVRTSVSGNSITIRWDKDTTGSVVRYILHWDNSAVIHVSNDRTAKIAATQTSYTHKNLNYSKTYYYSLTAVGKYGSSGYGNFKATTGAAPPTPQPKPPGAPGALYRYWGNGEHFYTTNWNELGSGRSGYKYEGIQCYIAGSQLAGTTPLYRYCGNGDHFYTTSWSELGSGRSGYKYEGIQGYVYSTQVEGTVPLYRYWGNGDHFYTTSWSELGSGRSGYSYEGIQCYVKTKP